MKIDLRSKIVLFSCLVITFGFIKISAAQQVFDKSVFYAVMATGDTVAINNEINILQKVLGNNRKGYEGALLMKKAELVVLAKRKLSLFKDGCIKLETALRSDTNNTELHFLRLSIQEHAPKIVKYHNDLEKDKLFIQKTFKSLSPVVRQAILDYCKTSKVIHAQDF